MRSAAIIAVAFIALSSMLATLSVFWVPRAGLGFALSGLTVTGVMRGSEAARAGIRVGDHLDPNLRFTERLRLLWYDDFKPGETVTLPIERNGSIENIQITAVQHPEVFTPVGEALMALRLLTYGIFVFVGAALVLRRPARFTWGFFLCCLGLATVPALIGRAMSSLDATLGFSTYIAWSIVADLANLGFLVFALRFPTDTIAGWRRYAWASLPVWFAAFVAIDIWRTASWYSGAGAAQWIPWSTAILGLAAWIVGTVSLATTYRATDKRNRKRLQWAIAGSSFGYLAWYVGALLSDAGFGTAGDIVRFATLALPISVGYTVLRYRVIDFRFALNRALTFSSLSIIVAGAFALTYLLTASLLLQSRAAVAVQVAVALVAGASLHRLHRWIDAAVSSLLFRDLRRARERLGRAGAALASATSFDSLESLLADEPVRALRLECAAVYRRQADGSFQRTATSGGPSDPERYSGDDPLILLLDAPSGPLRLDEASSNLNHTFALALPIRDDVELHAVAFYGPHRSGFDIDSGEVRLLAGLVQPAASSYRAIAVRAAHVRRLADLMGESSDGDTGRLSDFLADQIMESLPAADRALLLACAAFDEAMSDEVALVSADSTAESRLADLARATTFVRHAESGRFIVHPVLRQSLRRGMADGGYAGVLRCAAHWMQHGRFERAFELYATTGKRAQALGALAALLSGHEHARLASDQVDYVKRTPLPDLAPFPPLLDVMLSETFLIHDDPELRAQAGAWLDRIAPSDADPSSVRAWLAYCWSECGEHDRALRMLSHTDFDATSSLVRAMIVGKLGRLRECDALLKAADATVGDSSRIDILQCLARGAIIERVEGHWDQSQALLAQARTWAADCSAAWVELVSREMEVTAWLAGARQEHATSSVEMLGADVYPRPAAYALMMRAIESNDRAAAVELARRAAEYAEISGEPFIRVIALVLVSELDLARRDEHLAVAASLAEGIDSAPLSDAVTAVIVDADDAGMLAHLVRSVRTPKFGATATIRIEVAARRAMRDHDPIPLAEGELSLLLALARSPGPSRSSELVEILWPGLDESSGHKALQTCVYRLRSRLGDAGVVESIAQGYRLRTGTRVDLWLAERFLASLEKDRSLDRFALTRLQGLRRAFSASRTSPLDAHEWFAPLERRVGDVLRRVCLLLAEHSLREGRAELALSYARDLITADQLDEAGWLLAIRAHIALGDLSEGRRDFRTYRELLVRELGAEPPSSMAALVAPDADGGRQ